MSTLFNHFFFFYKLSVIFPPSLVMPPSPSLTFHRVYLIYSPFFHFFLFFSCSFLFALSVSHVHRSFRFFILIFFLLLFLLFPFSLFSILFVLSFSSQRQISFTHYTFVCTQDLPDTDYSALNESVNPSGHDIIHGPGLW